MARKPKQPSGGQRLIAAGRKPVVVGLTPDHHEKIRQAAEKERRSMVQFLYYHGLTAAEKTLGNPGENH